jgi:ubiquinone biosynthesis protein
MRSRAGHVAFVLAAAWLRGAWRARLGFAAPARRRAAFASEARIACERLGPAAIKVGQLISVRPDVFPPEWIVEMEALRDRVPATPAAEIRAIVAGEFGLGPEELFAEWDDVPVASASIAQVHRAVLASAYRPVIGAVLPTGTGVAVKVVRPGVEDAIARDARLAQRMAARLGWLPVVRRYRVRELLAEFSATLSSECDLRNEALVADRLGFDLRDDALVVIPRVVWPLTSRRVLTTEFVTGWQLDSLDDARRAGIDGERLARHGAEVFMRQVLEIGRYHADLHPANMLVTQDGRICYLDFGIVGRTTPAQRAAIAQVLAATVYADADRALRYSRELGLEIPREREARVRVRVDALMRATLAGVPRDVRGFALGFLGILAEERVEVPVGYGLLVKALVTVEGVARALYPQIDIVDTAGPFATRLVLANALATGALAEEMPRLVSAFARAVAE